MEQITQFCKDNSLPLVDLTKATEVWHKLEDDKFKGSYNFKQVTLKDKNVIVLTVYNFRSGESITERFGSADLSSAELKTITRIINSQNEEAKREKSRKQTECKTYANEQWATFEQVNVSANPYLARKIPSVGSYDGRTQVHQRTSMLKEVDLILPIVDFDGALWNYQSINEAGEKQILIGGRTQGCFIPILPTDFKLDGLGYPPRVYIVEGYSTGLSVFLALEEKFPVLCAISSTNLYNVVRELRGRYGKIPYIICADNDCWKRDNENTGKVTAEDVISRVDGGAYGLPDFSGCTDEQLGKKPTDFNDLHNLRGIDETRRQIREIVPNRPRVIYSLGYNGRINYFNTSVVPQIQHISEFSETDLLRLAPISYWELNFPNEKGKLDLQRAKSHLIAQCQSKGLFEMSRVRGRGLYKEGDRFVAHLGDRIRFLDNNEEKDLADVDSYWLYDPRSFRPFEASTPAPDLIPKIYKALQRFAWATETDALLCLGWILSAPLAGALQWRAHMALTAEAGTGKTTLLEAISSLLQGFQPLKAESITEAGLRQTLGSDAVPVILDEQDTNSLDMKSFDRIMNLFRMASSSGEVKKGTPTGKAMKFNACFSGLIAGINLPKMKHADQTRFCILELSPDNKRGSWADMSKEIKILLSDETARQLYAYITKNMEGTLRHIAETMPHIEETRDARTAQQYGALIGAAAAALGMNQIDSMMALDKYLGRDDVLADLKSGADTESCLEHLLNLTVQIDGERRKISLGRTLTETNEPTETLKQFNMKVEDGKLFIPNTHPDLSKHFDRTTWPNWNKTLKRLKGSESKVHRFGGVVVRGLLVPVEAGKPKY